MPKAAILAFEGCYASSLSGYADVLQVANAHLRKQQGATAPVFEWRFVTPSDTMPVASNGLPIQAAKLDARERYDVVFIPSLHYTGAKHLDRLLAQQQKSTCPWLIDQWRQGAVLAANCTGTFILAQSGLLDHRIATTTWWLERQFRSRFPRVDLKLQPVLTEADRLLCAGASASYLLQAVRIIEYFAGSVIASLSAKSMLIDVSQTMQTPYLPLLADKTHADSLVHRAQHWLQKHMSEDVRISSVAAALTTSERTLIRRFKAALEQTPNTYLQHLRIDTARTLLEAGDQTIGQIAHHVGYGDVSSFSRLFRQRVGLSPGAYRNRFQGSCAPR